MKNKTQETFNNMRTPSEDLNVVFLSDQALGAIMMALQNSLMNQTDIVPILKDLKMVHHPNEGLVVLNPPILRGSAVGEEG